MFSENAAYFFDRLGMSLRGVAGADDLLRFDAVDVGGLLCDHAVGLAGDRTVVEDAKCDTARCFRLIDLFRVPSSPPTIYLNDLRL
jgi:hypothetical protein